MRYFLFSDKIFFFKILNIKFVRAFLTSNPVNQHLKSKSRSFRPLWILIWTDYVDAMRKNSSKFI